MASLLADDTTEPLFTVEKSVTDKDNFKTKLDKYRNKNKRLRSRLDAIALRYAQSQNNENKIKQMLITVSEIKHQIDILKMESLLNIYSQRLLSNLKQAIYYLEAKMYNLRGEIEIFSKIKIYRSIFSVRVELKQDHDYESSHFNTYNRGGYPLSPCGLFVTNNIYVAKCKGHSITAFTLDGELLSYGDGFTCWDYIYRLNEKSRSVSHPWGIAVYNNYLYITEGSTLSKYTLAAKYNLVKRITSYGNDRRLKILRGIHVNNNGLIFVCDSWDNCIPIFDTYLEYQRTLSHKELVKPLEVKTHYEQVYVLAHEVIHVLSYEGSYLKQIAHGIKSNYFIIDNYNNIVLFTPSEIVILSLYDNNKVKCQLELSTNGFNGYLINNSNHNSFLTGTLVEMSNELLVSREIEKHVNRKTEKPKKRKTSRFNINLHRTATVHATPDITEEYTGHKYHNAYGYGYESEDESALFS